jgi:hypothetical protein
MNHSIGKGGRGIFLSHDHNPGLSRSSKPTPDYKTSWSKEVYSISLNDFSVLSCSFACPHCPFRDCLLNMSSLPLAQSADKQVLFARLGLNEQVHKMLLVGDPFRRQLQC